MLSGNTLWKLICFMNRINVCFMLAYLPTLSEHITILHTRGWGNIKHSQKREARDLFQK